MNSKKGTKATRHIVEQKLTAKKRKTKLNSRVYKFGNEHNTKQKRLLQINDVASYII